MITYCGFEDLRKEVGVDSVDDDDFLREKCEQASELLEVLCKSRKFYPRFETRKYHHPPDNHVLLLDDDLLEVSTLTTNNGSTEIPGGSYYSMRGRNGVGTPFSRIEVARHSAYSFTFHTTPQWANEVAGWWGYHTRWADAWVDSGDTVQDSGGISAPATTVTVANAAGAGAAGYPPRFKGQQLIKIDTEYLWVVRADPTGDALAVVRGVAGTTAATHDEGTAIYVYRPMGAVFRATVRLAAWLYKQKDSQIFDTTAYPELGVVEIPPGLPKDVAALLPWLRRKD